MSIEALIWAKRQRLKPLGGTVAHRAILMVLADYADESGECFPGQVLIAWETEQSERTVRRHLDDLEAWGLFARTARFRTDERSGRNVRTSDRFRLCLDVDLTDEPDSSTGQLDRRTSVTGGQVDRRSDPAFSPDNTPGVTPDTVDRVTDRGTDREEPTEQKAPSKRGKSDLVKMPQPFVITERCKEWAKDKLPHLPPQWFVEETEHFVGYHLAKANRFADWDLAWMNWMRRAAPVKRQVANRFVDTGDTALHARQDAMFEGTGTG